MDKFIHKKLQVYGKGMQMIDKESFTSNNLNKELLTQIYLTH